MARDALLDPEKSGGSEVPAATKLPGVSSVFGDRRRLTDITNLRRWETAAQKPFQEKGNPNNAVVSTDNKNDHSKLLKENATLLRLLGEKNQIIEQSRAEIQKLRMAINKLQVQNWQLAHTNSQMLAELNMGRDKLKTLEHELVCTAAALKTKSLEMEEKERMGQKLPSKIGNEEEKQLSKCDRTAEDESHGAYKIKLPKRKRASGNNRDVPDNSIGKDLPNVSSSTVICQVAEEAEEKDDNKKRCRRLRSSASKSLLSKMEVQSQPQPKILLIKDQAVHIESSVSSTSFVISSLENVKEQKAGKATPVSHSGSEKNKNRRCTRRCSGNLESRVETPPIKELVHNEEVQPTRRKSTSLCSTSTTVGEIGERNQCAEAAFSSKNGVQLDCKSTNQCSASTVMEKNECSASTVMEKNEQDQCVDVTISSEKEKKSQNQEVQRLSTGRPSRRATIGKSYKEMPLNVKMRRD